MKSFRNMCLMAFLSAALLFAGNALAAKVVVISGVDEASVKAIGSYLLVHEGIQEGLKIRNIVPEYQYVGLSGLTEEQKTAAGAAAIARVKDSKPDVIITLNDDCVKHVGMKIDDLPVVFAWIFGDPKAMGLPKDNVTGVTRRSYAADIWAMASKLTGGKTVALISKDNASMAGVKKYLTAGADKLQAASGVQFKDMYLVNTFAEWENCVKTFPADFIYMADTSRIVKDNNEMASEELVAWTVDNATVPVIAASEKDTASGALFSIVTSEKAIGMNAAEIALKILTGTKPADIPYVSSAKGKLVVNAKTAQRYKIDIPYDILSNAEKVYE